MKIKSIAAKIYVSFAIFIISLIILFITVNTIIRVNIAPQIFKNNEETINKTSYKIWEDSAMATAKTLASQIIKPLYKNDYYTAGILASKLGENRNIEFTYILDENGIVVAEDSEDSRHTGYPLKDYRLREFTSPCTTVSGYVTKDIFCISHPVIFADELLGKVFLGFKADQIKDLLSEASVNNQAVFTSFYSKLNILIAVASAIVLLLMFYVVYIFNKHVSKPLLRLTERANDAAKGSYDFSRDEDYSHEFQKLNEAFITMIEVIYSRENKLVQAYENIESEVRIRTKELQQTKEELRKKAFYDSLTGLSNRALFYDRLGLAMNRSKRHNSLMALMFLDIDNFKQVNDTLGHDHGDMLLKEVARRLKDCARETDTVCRLGGDEFVIILNDVDSKEMLGLVANRIIKHLSKPVTLANQTMTTSASIGITFYPDDGEEIDKLMKNADLAMYKAKSQSKGTYQYYSKNYEESVNFRFYQEHKISKAIKSKSFIPHFQPIIDDRNGKIVGIEALARWQDDGEIHAPATFLEIVEEMGLMHEMTLDIIEASLAYMNYLNALGFNELWLSLNISPSSLDSKTKVEEYFALMDKYDFEKYRVVFEITENLLIKDFKTVEPVLQFVKNNNIQIALDDFGTGYSSLNYLHALTPDKLKLDRSFVRDFTIGKTSSQICSSVCHLAKEMNMSIIAEGVETAEQLEALREIGYRYFQGYYFAQPQDRRKATELIIKQNGLPEKMECKSI